MAAELLLESYVMATGYAALMGADTERQHLFARNYDFPVTVDKLKTDWEEFAERAAELAETDRRVAAMRRCRHNLWHYFDANGNRRCLDCRAFVRPVEGAAICKAPDADAIRPGGD
jgi:hypothetical protein